MTKFSETLIHDPLTFAPTPAPCSSRDVFWVCEYAELVNGEIEW